jgi:C6 transcription factor Pro1
MHKDCAGWKILLDTATLFLLPEHVLSSASVSMCQIFDDKTCHPDKVSWLPLFKGSLMWIDLLSCISSNFRVPSFCISFRHLLECPSPIIDLSQQFGCENWAFGCILDIVLLDRWKYEQESAGMLSHWELVSRYNQIKSTLEAGLKDMPEQEEKEGNKTNAVITVTTGLYAHTALLYLYSVISWPVFETPEIKASVNWVAQTFEGIADASDLRNLVWPFCVAGSLATEDQESAFRAVTELLDEDSRLFTNFLAAFKVIEACWANRCSVQTSRQHFYPWQHGMDKMLIHALLI